MTLLEFIDECSLTPKELFILKFTNLHIAQRWIKDMGASYVNIDYITAGWWNLPTEVSSLSISEKIKIVKDRVRLVRKGKSLGYILVRDLKNEGIL